MNYNMAKEMPLVEKIIRTTRNTPQTKSHRKEVESLTQVNKHDNAVYLKRQRVNITSEKFYETK
jgi:hypothetical protein